MKDINSHPSLLVRFALTMTIVTSALMFACNEKTESNSLNNKLFTLIDPDNSGIHFENKLEFDSKFNIYTYRNFYDGGGVAIGDINGDSLPDIYFSANMGGNKLYLNKGNLEFEDMTAKAGVEGRVGSWSTGVTMADVNGDGWLDIYVCHSGEMKDDSRKNELFINQQNGTFKEQAEQYGLADDGYTIHAVFFDYDLDGDLDCFVLNNSYQSIGSFNLRQNVRNVRDAMGGDKFFRNDDNHFVDVSEQAGIYGSVIGFGLGVTVSDLNLDGWPDIYVSNDFFEKDYIYINKHDGSFSEELESRVNSTSAASMGADIADINNDLYPDIFVTDMLPQNEQRLKTKTTFDNWQRYKYSVDNGYYHQFTRNTLQLNNGNGTFSEIGRYAGVEATDWSWGALFADFDNDGWKDLFVANGIYQDLTDQDFLNYIADKDVIATVTAGNKVDYKKLISAIPSEKITNYGFKNNRDLTFTNSTAAWGLDNPSHSNGSAYSDLDGDGDLDLVINNVNTGAFLYRNNQQNKSDSTHYLQIHLKEAGKNPFAVGSKLTAYYEGNKQYYEYMPMKGFESSMDYAVHIGLGDINIVDSLIVISPYGKKQVLKHIKADQQLWIDVDKGSPVTSGNLLNTITCMEDITSQTGLSFIHHEDEYVDFDRDQFLFMMKSTEGPHMATGDLNGDHLEDLIFAGAKGQTASMYLQDTHGRFQLKKSSAFEKDSASEDADISLFDIDLDGDMDVFICSGGIETAPESSQIFNRLYINDGHGNFTKASTDIYSPRHISSGAVAAGDMDGDGDSDLFIGERLKPFAYGVPCDGYLYRNDKGKLIDVTDKLAPALKNIGMITDAVWYDMDGDHLPELIICGEFMPVTIFKYQNGLFVNTVATGLKESVGWWNVLKIADINGDGRPDIIAGNHGLNSRFRTSVDHPLCMYVNDFDKNGSIEQIICSYNGTESYPMLLRHDLLSRMPSLKKKYLSYKDFANQHITDIFSLQQMEQALRLEATCFESSVFINHWPTFERKALPAQAQFSPLFGLSVIDITHDGIPDLITGGNLFGVKPEIGRFDASDGFILEGDGHGNFSMTSPSLHLCVKGEVRDMETIKRNGKIALVVARNNNSALIFSIP
ncbi:MAG: VCBS repeat-containing protein [Saprospiraceae bacterium]